MTTEDLALQIGSQLASAPKGVHILLCSLLEEAGGSVSFDVGYLTDRAISPAAKLRVEWEEDSVVLRLIDPTQSIRAE